MPTMINDDDDDPWDIYHNGDHDVQWDDNDWIITSTYYCWKSMT